MPRKKRPSQTNQGAGPAIRDLELELRGRWAKRYLDDDQADDDPGRPRRAPAIRGVRDVPPRRDG